ncbi:MAG TPA: hypothetical protein PKU86_07385 [Bacteroidales bacterium]|nr:hypothetical protein [Bacteroidales bacterium]
MRAQWDMVHNPAIFTPLQSDGDGAAFGNNIGDIVVVANDTIKIRDIVFGESKSYTKNYYWYRRLDRPIFY